MRRLEPAVTLVAAGLVLAACSSPTVAGSAVRVAVTEPLTSLNAETSFGRASTTNADVAYLTGTGFGYSAPDGSLVLDESFGTAEIVQAEPLIVRYTIAAGLRWSDGASLDAVDLLLAWAAGSGALNDPDFDPEPFVDPDTGRYRDDFPGDVVFFDGPRAGGIEQAVSTPVVVDERTLLIRFERFVPGWRTLLAPGIPAHVLAGRALPFAADGGSQPERVATAKAAVRRAIEDREVSALAALSREWNLGFDLAAEPPPENFPAAGPYRLVAVDEDGGAVLQANERYAGQRRPAIETILLRVSADPLETAALFADGELDVAAPLPSEDLLAALGRIEGVTAVTGLSARIEHLDLQLAGGRSGVFADPLVREAFLLTVPREDLVAQLVRPLRPDAEPLASWTVREADPAYPAVVAENGSARFATPDPVRARTLLAQAGVASPHVCILFDSSDPRRRAAFELIAGAAGQAGFEVSDCSRQNWESLLGVAGVYDAALFSWDTARLGPEAIGRVFHSAAALVNFTGFADPAVDAIVDELQATDDSARRTELLAELDARVWAAGYGLPLYTHPAVTVVSDRVTDVVPSPLVHGALWNAWEWRPAE